MTKPARPPPPKFPPSRLPAAKSVGKPTPPCPPPRPYRHEVVGMGVECEEEEEEEGGRRGKPHVPPPYQGKPPPPLPPKKKKTAVEGDSTAISVSQDEPVSQEGDQPIIAEEGKASSPVYEPLSIGVEEEGEEEEEECGPVVCPPKLLSRPENIERESVSSLDTSGSQGDKDTLLPIGRSRTMASSEDRKQRKVASNSRYSVRRPPSTASDEFLIVGSTKLDEYVNAVRDNDSSFQDTDIYGIVKAVTKAMPHIASTSDLPRNIEPFPGDKRSLHVRELYTTEFTYVAGLEVLVEVYRDGLCGVLGEDVNHLFGNVDDILAFNKGFLALLHSRLMDWSTEDQCIGDLFLGMFTQAHKSMYAIYCSNFDNAEMCVQKLKGRKDVDIRMEACMKNHRVFPGLNLLAYLITPVQRVPRYILILKDIIKLTPETHPDCRQLQQALQRMGELADYIDTQVKEVQTKKDFESLKNKVQGLKDVESPDRSLVRDGQVYLKNIKKLYQCILFNDLLVFAHGDSRLSTVELQLALDAIWIMDLEDLDPQTSNEDAIELYTPERPYTIYTCTSMEKRLWLAKLRETIYNHLYQENKCVRSEEFLTESRFAQFVYSDRRVYAGNYVGAMRHGKGTMSWPNKTVYVGDWEDDERSGEGELTYNTGDVYHGRWIEDKQNGMGELRFVSNDMYRGQWKDGVRHGSGKIFFANNDLFEGQFVNGQIEGHGILKCTNGMEYVGEFRHSQRHGKGTLKTVTGNVYTGEFKGNVFHGSGAMVFCSGDEYSGSWKNGMRQGRGMLTGADGSVYSGNWDRNMQCGFGNKTYPNKDRYEGGWEMNRRHGEGTMWYSTGQVYKGEFFNDLPHGEGEIRYSSRCKYHGSWLHGLKHGKGTMVYDNMSTYSGDWNLDLRHGYGEQLNSDASSYKGMWVNDRYHGTGTFYIPSVNYSYEGRWECGLRHGRGKERSQYGTYDGEWVSDQKQGHGQERSLVGTTYEGTWERNWKHGRGIKKMVFGATEEQVWKYGQLMSDPARMTAVELPWLSRNDY